MISHGFTDWNHVVGIRNEPIMRLVDRSVKMLMLDPACSKDSQNTALNSMNRKIEVTGPRSAAGWRAVKYTAQAIAAAAISPPTIGFETQASTRPRKPAWNAS